MAVTTLARDLHLSLNGQVIFGRDELVEKIAIIKDGAIAKLSLAHGNRSAVFAGNMSVRGTDVTFVTENGAEFLIYSDSYNNLTIQSFQWLRVAV